MNACIERWLPVVGYEEIYEVSDFGSVRGLRRIDAQGRSWAGKLMKPSTVHGYLKIQLCNGRRRIFPVHNLVLAAFVGPRPPGMDGCHNNGDKGNNSLVNLRWDTPKNNHADKKAHGTTARGERHGLSVLTDISVERAFDLRKSGLTHRGIAEWLMVSRSTVSKALCGDTWAHIKRAA